MSEAKAGSEPSMEEILASIRQIINQNDKPADDAGAVPSATDAASSAMPTSPVAADVDDAPEDDEVLELTDILAEAQAEAVPEPQVEMIEMQEEVAAPVAAAPAVQPAPQPAPQPVRQPAPAAAAPVAENAAELISNTSAAAAAAALGTLATTLQQEKMEHSLPVGNGMRTLESMAVEALKPLLKEWLDSNLPTIVERIVQQEVEKLTKRLGV